jgi:hypothetical protein
MRRLFLTLIAAAALLTVGATTAAGPSSAADCETKNTTYGGVRARTYCGPARAVVKIGGRTLRYRGGSCMRNRVAVELGIGTLILDSREPNRPLPRSFGISVGRVFGIGQPARHDGSYDSVTLAFVDNGKRYASFEATAELSGGRTRGTFTGRLLTGKTISGSFRCK